MKPSGALFFSLLVACSSLGWLSVDGSSMPMQAVPAVHIPSHVSESSPLPSKSSDILHPVSLLSSSYHFSSDKMLSSSTSPRITVALTLTTSAAVAAPYGRRVPSTASGPTRTLCERDIDARSTTVFAWTLTTQKQQAVQNIISRYKAPRDDLYMPPSTFLDVNIANQPSLRLRMATEETSELEKGTHEGSRTHDDSYSRHTSSLILCLNGPSCVGIHNRRAVSVVTIRPIHPRPIRKEATETKRAGSDSCGDHCDDSGRVKNAPDTSEDVCIRPRFRCFKTSCPGLPYLHAGESGECDHIAEEVNDPQSTNASANVNARVCMLALALCSFVAQQLFALEYLAYMEFFGEGHSPFLHVVNPANKSGALSPHMQVSPDLSKSAQPPLRAFAYTHYMRHKGLCLFLVIVHSVRDHTERMRSMTET